jgi:Caudovirus prohead serine protease
MSSKHWKVPTQDCRFADVAPQSYSKKDRTVDAVISMGSPVQRFYGTEVLRIDEKSVVLDRVRNGGIPVLDSHQQIGISNSLGRINEAWIKRGALMGRIKFHQTPEGRKAEGMVSRNEIIGVSAGYRVNSWEITDADGDVLDPETDKIPWDSEGLTFTATEWELHECSLVSVPADASAGIRSGIRSLDLGRGDDRPLSDVVGVPATEIQRRLQRLESRMGSRPASYTVQESCRARMQARHNMMMRMSRLRGFEEDDDEE